jgi:hypothetical protein
MIKKSNIISEQTIDFLRVEAAKKHVNSNSVIIAGRECVHNATGYNANEMLFFNFKKTDRTYFSMAHDGEKFKDKEDLVNAFKLNFTGGKGVQGSGGKMGMFCNVSDIKEAEYLILAKTVNDGELVYSLTVKPEDDTRLIVTDKTSTFLPFMKKIMNEGKKYNGNKKDNDVYKRYNVIYMYHNNISGIDNSKKSLTRTSNINGIVNVTDHVVREIKSHNVKLNYLPKIEFGLDKTVVTKHMYPIKTPLTAREDFKFKSYKEKFKDVTYKLSNGKILKYDLTVEIATSLNVHYNDDKGDHGLLSLQNIKKNERPYYSNEKFMKPTDYENNGFTVYQNISIGKGKNKDRAKNEPLFWTSQQYSFQYFDDLGIPKPNSGYKWNSKKDLINEYLKNDPKYINYVDYKKLSKWEPTASMYVTIDSAETYDSFGNLDNCFYSLNDEKLRDILKKGLNQCANRPMPNISKYVEDVKDLIKPVSGTGLLRYKQNQSKNRPRIRAIVLDTPNNRSIKNIKVDKNGYLKSLPVNMTSYLEVELIGPDRKPLILDKKDSIEFEVKGIFINRNPKSEGKTFDIITDDYHHYNIGDDEHDNRIPHTEEEHKNVFNYFPKKKNKITINDDLYDIEFDVAVKLNKKEKSKTDSKRGKTNNKERTRKPEYKEYYKGPEEDYRIAYWDHANNAPVLNIGKQIVKSFAINFEKESKNFSEVYDEIASIGRKVYLNSKFDNTYNLTYGGNGNLSLNYGDGRGFRFNELIESFLKYSPQVKKLRKSHEEYVAKSNSSGLEDGSDAVRKSPKAFSAKNNVDDSSLENTEHKSVSKIKKAFGSK